MHVFKNFADLLEVAVRIERQGIDFYNRLSTTIDSSQAKDVFSFLAAEEEKHSGVFRMMLEKTADYAPRFNYPGEYGLFIDGVASRLLEKVRKVIGSLPSRNINEALDMGIEFEKESILFYTELKLEGGLDKANMETLQEIIDEERKHWLKLISLEDKLKF